MHRSPSSSTTWTRRGIGRSTTWTRRLTVLLAGLATALPAVPAVPAVASTAPGAGQARGYVVRAVPGHLPEVTAALRGLGTVSRQLALIDADVAQLTPAAAARAARLSVVASVTPDRAVSLASARDRSRGVTETLAAVADTLGAGALRARGIDGAGVDVALVDSGIAAVDGLQGAVVAGADLSDDADKSAHRFVDDYGHGTHLAGIIAGDARVGGLAPGARLVNVKVADGQGRTDVSTVIAGIDWVVTHAHRDGLNIRVLNLSFGTDSEQDYDVDPLAYAAEQAWHAGLVVVVSAGNRGVSSRGLSDPAIDPFVLAVGAADTTGRTDGVATFSSRGDGVRNPDLVAPGAHLASLRVPGSEVDDTFGAIARTPDGLFRGSGTSQAAAVVSGAVALLLDGHPALTPDQVKAALTGTADDLGYRARAQGAGMADLAAADRVAGRTGGAQDFPRSDGSGSLAEAGAIRGSAGQGWGGQGWGGQGWGSQGWLGQGWLSQGWLSQGWL